MAHPFGWGLVGDWRRPGRGWLAEAYSFVAGLPPLSKSGHACWVFSPADTFQSVASQNSTSSPAGPSCWVGFGAAIDLRELAATSTPRKLESTRCSRGFLRTVKSGIAAATENEAWNLYGHALRNATVAIFKFQGSEYG